MRHNSIHCKYYSMTACIAVLSLLGVVRGAVAIAQTAMEPKNTNAETVVRYETVQPILRKHCVGCHNDNEARGGLSLASLDKILAGSASGNVVVAGQIQDSPLYLVTAHIENPKMPPNKPRIPQRELNLIEKWIATGLATETGKASESTKDKMPAAPATATQDNAKATLPTPLFTALPQASPLNTFAVHPKRPLVAIPGVGQVLLLEQDSRSAPIALPIEQNAISSLEFNADGSLLFVATGVPAEWGKVLRWSFSENKWLEPIGQESDVPLCLAISPDEKKIAIGSPSKTTQVYSLETTELLYKLEKHTDWVTSVRWSPDGLLLASGDRFGAIQVWDAESGDVFASLRNHVGAITGLIWSSDSDQLFSTGWDGTIRRWDMHSQSQVASWTAHDKGSLGLLSVSDWHSNSNESLLASYGRDGQVSLWDFQGQRQLSRTFEDEVTMARYVNVPSMKPALAISPSDGTLHWVKANADRSAIDVSGTIPIPIAQQQTLPFQVRKPKIASRLASKVKTTPVASDPTIRQQMIENLEENKATLSSIEASREHALATLEQLDAAANALKKKISQQEILLKRNGDR